MFFFSKLDRIRVQGEHLEEPSWQLSSGRSRNYSHTYMIADYRFSAGLGSHGLANRGIYQQVVWSLSLNIVYYIIFTSVHMIHRRQEDLKGSTFFFIRFSQGVCM